MDDKDISELHIYLSIYTYAYMQVLTMHLHPLHPPCYPANRTFCRGLSHRIVKVYYSCSHYPISSVAVSSRRRRASGLFDCNLRFLDPCLFAARVATPGNCMGEYFFVAQGGLGQRTGTVSSHSPEKKLDDVKSHS